MPLLASLRTGLAALCRKFIICIRLPDYAYYINGPETLPPPLSKEEEKVVFAGLEAGNPDCRDVLIVHNLRLVVYIAKKFESKTASVEDMISIGTIGLIKAVNTFVPSKNIKLATYASRCIENEILMYLRKSSNKRQESSIDEPLNTDCDGNELLLSDVLGTDGNQVGADLEQAAEKNMQLCGIHAADLHLVIIQSILSSKQNVLPGVLALRRRTIQTAGWENYPARRFTFVLFRKCVPNRLSAV